MEKLQLGSQVNHLTILSMERHYVNERRYDVLCECKCGSKKLIPFNSLRAKRIRDCGCGTYMLDKYIGLMSGKLTVIKTRRERISGRVNIVCDCKCDCGNSYTTTASKITGNYVTHCGCENTWESHYIGKVFNGIEVLSVVDDKKHIVLCKCKCGNLFECKSSMLTRENYIIGCNKCPEFTGRKTTKYILKHKTVYNKPPEASLRSIYYFMKQRCYNECSKDYRMYGGRGISICNEWLQDVNKFIEWSIENGYKQGLTIDRINTYGNYEPTNCRWTTVQEQNYNKRNNVFYEYKGALLTLGQIAKLENFNVNTLRTRVRAGLDIYTAINKPIQKKVVKK